jgi:hypothetical protein
MANEEFDITQLGEPVGRAVEDEQVNLGRATDLSFLGDVGQDPVGAVQAGAEELIRTGEIGGLQIERDKPFTPFPLEPGESRAAKELPELFMGKVVMNPAYEEMEARLDNPDMTLSERVGVMQSLQEMEGSETIRTPAGVGAGLDLKDAAMISAAALTMFDPAEVAQMLTQVDPETGERRWPQFGISHAPDGTIIVANNENGTQAVINRPGMSAHDAVQMIGIGAAFTPAGKLTSMAPSLAGRMAVGATTAGLTEAAIQETHELAGGQFDHLDVALSAGIGPAIDLARPAMGLVQRTGRFIGSYIPENFFGIQTAWQGIQSVLPKTKAQVLAFSKQAKEFLQSGRNAIVTTQDAVPEAHTPFRQILLKMVERMPLTGTGGLRIAQREERVETLRWLADRFNLNPNTNYGGQVIRSLNRNAGKQLQAARGTINTAIDAMEGKNVILRDFRLTIRDLIEEESARGDLANQGVIKLLNKVRNGIWQGGRAQDFGRSFGGLNDWLQYLYMQSASASPGARGLLDQAGQALRRDLTRHATAEGGEAGARWLAASTQVDTLIKDAGKKTLKALIEAGNVDQQVIRQTMKSGDDKLMRFMVDNLSDDGVHAARQMVLRDAMRVAGWRRTEAAEAIVDPKKFLRWMETENVEKQLRHLFPEGAERETLTGMMEYLRMTAQAQETGRGVGMAAAGGMGQMSANAMNLVTLGLVGALGHAYQSAPVRNLLLRLEHVKGDPRMKDAIMEQLTPLLMGGGRQMAQEWQADDPHDSVYVSDEFVEVQQDRELSLVEQGMEQLRAASGAEGAEAQEEVGVTGRLMQMLGFGDEEEEVPVE